MAELPTRWRIFLLLADGQGLKAAAERVGIKKSAAHAHALKLEADRLLQRRRTPRGQPLLYERGARAAEADAAIGELRAGRPSASRVGRSGPPAAGCRVHRGGYLFRVIEGPRELVPWDRAWNPNKAAAEPSDYALRRVLDSGTWRFWAKASKGRVSSLVVQPPEEWVWDPRKLKEAARERAERVRAVAGAFAKEFGFRFAASRPEIVKGQAVEYAFPVSGLAPFGTPGVDPVWVDQSPGEGQPEVETGSPALAAAIAGLPGFQRRVESNLEAVGRILNAHAAAIEAATALEQGLAAVAAGPPRPRSLPPESDPSIG